MKRILSFVLSFVLVVTAVTCFKNNLFVQIVQAANPGESVTSNGYTYIQEPPYMHYDSTDPNQMQLFSTARITNYAASGTDYHHLTGAAASAGEFGGTGNIGGSFLFESGAGNTSNCNYSVIKTTSDSQANGNAATASETTFMNNWGITRMARFQTTAKAGIAEASGTCYYFNLIYQFDRNVDISNMTHLYLDFWVSDTYTKGTDGKLNVALWDDAYNSKLDGFEFNIDFSKLQLDDGNPCTGHRYYLDLRDFAQTNTQYGTTINLNSINGVTLRYTSSSSSTQYTSTGKSPTIYVGKMIAFRRTDNLQLGYSFSDSGKDPNQGFMYALTGYQRYNDDIVVHYPLWIGKSSNGGVVGLPVGDKTNTGVDYHVGGFDLASWRWRRNNMSATGSTIELKSFPTNYTYSTGGGNQGLAVTRNNTKYITAHGQKAYTVS